MTSQEQTGTPPHRQYGRWWTPNEASLIPAITKAIRRSALEGVTISVHVPSARIGDALRIITHLTAEIGVSPLWHADYVSTQTYCGSTASLLLQHDHPGAW